MVADRRSGGSLGRIFGTGIAVAALAVRVASAYGRTHGLSWMAPIIGGRTIVSPWVARSGTTSSIWTNVVTGIVNLLLGLCAVAVMMMHPGR
jgi:hypothetical protein